MRKRPSRRQHLRLGFRRCPRPRLGPHQRPRRQRRQPSPGATIFRSSRADRIPTAAGMIPACRRAVSSRSPAAPARSPRLRLEPACAKTEAAPSSRIAPQLPALPASRGPAWSTARPDAALPTAVECPKTSAPTQASAAALAATASPPSAAARSSGFRPFPARPSATAGSAKSPGPIPSAAPQPYATAASNPAPATARSNPSVLLPAAACWGLATCASGGVGITDRATQPQR